MKWHPTPPSARLPSGTRVEVFVRAAGAEVGGARDGEHLPGTGFAGLRLDERDSIVDPARRVEMRDTLRERARHVLGRDLRKARQQRPARLVLLPDDPWASPVRQRIERVADLELGEGHLLLDHEDLFEAVREVSHRLRVERVRHRHLEHRDPDVVRGPIVDAEIEERLAHVVERLAGGDDPVAWSPARDRHPVQPVGACVGHGGVEFPAPVAGLHLVPEVGDPQVESARRHLEVAGERDLRVEGVRRDRRARIHRVRHRLVAHPCPAEPGERDAVQAVAQHLLHGGGVEEGHHELDEGELVGGRRVGRGQRVVVADHHQHPRRGRELPAMWPWRTASMLRSRPGPLPYHMEKMPSCRQSPNAVACCVPQMAVAARSSLMAGWKWMAGPGQEALRGPQLLVDVVHRGAAVAGDVAGGVEARRAVADALHHREAHDRLAAGDVAPSFPALVLVVQRYRRELHDHPPVTANGQWRVAHGVRRTPLLPFIRLPSSCASPSVSRIRRCRSGAQKAPALAGARAVGGAEPQTARAPCLLQPYRQPPGAAPNAT